MTRKWLAGLLMALGGCSTVPDWVPSMLRGNQADAAAGTPYQFHWTLSGNRSVSPLQVFDDGQRTWLQFAPGQALPAVFRAQGAGDVLVRYTVQDPYVVLPGVWPRLSFRGGSLQGMAVRGAPEEATPSTASARPMLVDPLQASLSAPVAPPVPEPSPASAFAVSVMSPAQVNPAQGSLPSADTPAPAALFDVGPADGTLRAALSRWARASGWTFQPEHWAVDVDIPINGSASFPGGFTQAVESLVAATELSDRPLQPCFYANQVLRVVPYAQPCDRSVGTLPRAS